MRPFDVGTKKLREEKGTVFKRRTPEEKKDIEIGGREGKSVLEPA